MIIFSGEPGIGKTRLLEAAIDEATARSFIVLSATNFEQTRAPLGPWVDIMRALRSVFPHDAPPDIADRTAYEQLIGVSDRTLNAVVDRRRLFVIVAEALERASRRTSLCIAIDDAQWADPETAEMLDYLAPRLPTSRIVVLVGRRAGNAGQASLALSGLERYPGVKRLAVGALTDAEVSQLVATLSPRADSLSSSLIEEICRRSDGNPLFAAELVRSATTPGTSELLPESVQLTVVARLAELDAEDVHILEVASVIGRVFALEELTAIAAIDDVTAIRVLRKARDTGLIIDDRAGRFAFRHELLRAAVYDSIFSAERSAIHRATAQALSASEGVPAALLAYHWSRAGDAEQAVRYAVRAGDEALAINAYGSARDSYVGALNAGALTGTERAAVEEKAAIAYDALGAAEDAAIHFANAANLFRSSGETQRAAKLDLRFAANAYRAGRASEVERVCGRVLAESTDPEVLYGAHAILASFYTTRDDPDRVRRHIAEANALGVEGQVRDALSIAWASASVEQGPDAWILPARHAVELAATRGSPALHALNLMNFAMISRWHGQEGPERSAAIESAIHIADQNGATYTAAYARCEHALTLHFHGELDAAYRVLLEAVALHVEAVVVRIFMATVGLFILSDLGAIERFPMFRDPALLEAAFATGEPGRFAWLAAAHVYANESIGDTAPNGSIIKRALALIRSFSGVSRSLVIFAIHGDADDRSQIAALLPSSGLHPPEELDRLLIDAIVANETNDPAALTLAQCAADAAHTANAPLFEAMSYMLLDRPQDALAIYERIGARGQSQRVLKDPRLRRRASKSATSVP